MLAVGPERKNFEILPSSLKVNNSEYSFDGGIRPVAAGADSKAQYQFEIVTDTATVAPLNSASAPIEVAAILGGRFVPSDKVFALDRIRVRTGSGELTGAASIVAQPDGRALYAAIRSEEMNVDDFKQLWPSFAAPGARRWVLANVFGGTARDVAFDVAIPPKKAGRFLPLTPEELSGSARLEGVRFDTTGSMPPVRGADLNIRLSGIEASVVAENGQVFLDNGAAIGLNKATFSMPDTYSRPLRAAIDVATKPADANAVARLAVTAKPDAFAAVPFSPDAVRGSAKAEGRVDLVFVRPDEEKVPPKISAKVAFSDLEISEPVAGQTITAASGMIDVSEKETSVTADMRANGLPARISLVQPADPKAQPTRQVTLTVDKQTVAKLAPGFAPFFDGKARMVMDLLAKERRIEADLTDTVLKLPAIGWTKPAGQGAKARFRLAETSNGLTIDDLVIEGRGLSAKGKLNTKDGALRSASLTNVRLREGDNFSVDVTREGARTVIRLGGNQIDARDIITTVVKAEQEGSGSGPAISVSGSVAAVLGHNGVVLGGAQFEQGAQGISMSGNLSEGGSIRLTYQQVDGKKSATLQTDNAGAFLRFADLYKRLRGGVLNVNLKPTAKGGGLVGPVAMSDFVVVGEPKLTRLMSAGSTSGTTLDEATGGRIRLDEARFKLASGVIIRSAGGIALRDGIVRGEAVGLTAEGVLLSSAGGIDIRGSFLPAYGLNSLVGGIPVLGAILGGGQRRGLIGVTYRLAGRAKEPIITINPLSIITPGIFRQIFE